MGIHQPELEVHDWTPGKFDTVPQFAAVCELADLLLAWGHDQIIAFLNMIDTKHYAVTTIDAFWSSLKRIGKAVGKDTTKRPMHVLQSSERQW